MTEKHAPRKLAAVLAADVVGYSRLMQDDDQATLQALNARRALFADQVTGHGGSIVNAPGDSILAEFVSVVSAVQCALELQRALEILNMDVAETRRMRFRIGVHLGDVLVDGSGIYGDGVNVAARLESLAEPGEICVSGAVHDQVEGKHDLLFDDLGEKQVKNIARPVRVYRLQIGPRAAIAATPRASASRPPLSIVVLPFDNLSGDVEQGYLADAITDDLTTDLSRIAGSFVIARNSAFTYKGRPVDVKEVGRELGVQYVLEGSVRRAGNRVRVNAQLIETESGTHIWADRFDRELGDMLALQDDITGSIARVLRYELIEAESGRSLRERPIDPHAIDCALRAVAILLRAPTPTKESMDASRQLYEQALRLDPNLIEALVGLAQNLAYAINSQWMDEPEAVLARMETLIAQAESIAPADARVLQARGNAWLQRRRPELALPILEAAHARDPNATMVLLNIGWCKIFLGEPAASIANVERVLHLDPRGRNRGNIYGVIGIANLYLGKYDESIRYSKLCCEEQPSLAFPRFALTAACALAGRMEEAHAALNEFRSMRPGVGIAQLRREALSTHPRYLELRERVYDGLRLAGLDE